MIIPRQTFFAKIPGLLTTERLHPDINVLKYLAIMIVLTVNGLWGLTGQMLQKKQAQFSYGKSKSFAYFKMNYHKKGGY